MLSRSVDVMIRSIDAFEFECQSVETGMPACSNVHAHLHE